MNSRSLNRRAPWSRGDRFLMFVIGLVVPAALGLTLWLRALDQNPDVPIPTPPMPSPNARAYYIAAGEAVVDGSKISHALTPWDPATRPSGDNHFYSLSDRAKLVAENAGAIKTLHAGFQYPYQEPTIRSFVTPLPHYQKMRGLAYVLALQAEVDAKQGDWNGAVSANLDAVQLGEAMPRGGPLLGMLVGDACQAIGRKHAWEAVDHLDAAQARAAARHLETIRLSHVPLADTLQEEEWCVQAGLLELMRRRGWPGNLIAEDQREDSPILGWRGAAQIRMAGKRTVMANYTHYMDQSIVNARLSYAAHPGMPSVPTDPVNQMLLPVFAGGHTTEVNAETQNALLLTALALRAYKLEHGAYPPTLSALVPHYLQAVPADPFALSGPLRYKAGAKPLLYSVGPDGRDDGGQAIYDRAAPAVPTSNGYDRRRAVQENSIGDIVAGVNTG